MANKHIKRCSTLLIIREMQIKTTMSITSHLSELPSSKNLQTLNAREGVGEKGNFLHSWLGIQIDPATLRTVWRFLKKLVMKPPYDPPIPLLDIYPEETIIKKDTCSPMFTAALFTIAKTWKKTRCPLTDEWIKKFWYIYSMEYYSHTKRNAFDTVLIR